MSQNCIYIVFKVKLLYSIMFCNNYTKISFFLRDYGLY